MKFRKTLLITFVICTCIVFATGCSFLASMNKTVLGRESSSSEITFDAKKGNKIEINYNSTVKKGTLKLKLEDSDGKLIEEFESNKKDSKQIELDKDDEYKISAEYTDFAGNYSVKVNKK